jgi:thioredoxin reductase (NADPH)
MALKLHKTDIAVIGAGPCGLFAVFQAGMLGLKSVVIDALDVIGGQCTALYPEKPIYDIPGFPEINGTDLIHNLEKQAAPFYPVYILGKRVEKLEKHADGSFKLVAGDIEIEAKVIIIAAGGGAFGPNRPPLAGIENYEGRSVFYAIAKKDIFKNKKVVIAGGGDSAVDWAISLSEIAERVSLVHRRDHFRAFDANVEKLRKLVEEKQVELLTPYQLHALEGVDGALQKVVIADLDGNERHVDADYLLPFFGLSMDLGPINDWGLELEKKCLKISPETMETNSSGIYAIGDVVHYPGKLKLILTGFAEAAVAVHSAYKHIFPDKHLHFEHSTTKGLPTGL